MSSIKINLINSHLFRSSLCIDHHLASFDWSIKYYRTNGFILTTFFVYKLRKHLMMRTLSKSFQRIWMRGNKSYLILSSNLYGVSQQQMECRSHELFIVGDNKWHARIGPHYLLFYPQPRRNLLTGKLAQKFERIIGVTSQCGVTMLSFLTFYVLFLYIHCVFVPLEVKNLRQPHFWPNRKLKQ